MLLMAEKTRWRLLVPKFRGLEIISRVSSVFPVLRLLWVN